MLDLRQLAKICTTKKVVADDVFFYQGDPGSEMFILLSGAVGVYLSNIDGSFKQITKLYKGNFFGEMSLLEEAPRSATIQAVEDSMVLVINKENFQFIVTKQPQFAFRLLKVLSGRIRDLNQRLMEHESMKTDSKRKEKRIVPAPSPVFSQEIPPQKKELYENKEKYASVVALENHSKYLFDKEITCPCCKQQIQVKMMRTTIIPLERIDADLREHYKGFEPLWYQIWVCSLCGYSSFHLTFLQLSKRVKDFVKEKGPLMFDNFSLGFSEPRNLYEVFDAYFHLLFIMENTESSPMDLGIIWLRICWLYRDAGDEENEKFAATKALHYYQNAYYNTSMAITPKQDARMNLLMGELLYQTGEQKEALRIFRNALNNKEGEEFVKFHAENRARELKAK